MRTIRQSIIDGRFAQFVKSFMLIEYRSIDKVPPWVCDALAAVNLKLNEIED
jgi:queuine tRNA-ribosyltransferase